jgi:fumarate hydratase subunit beta
VNLNKINIFLDKDIKILRKAKSGTFLSLTGRLYSFRDAAHKRLKEMYDLNKQIPLDLKNSVIYYMGPSPAKPGNPIGSCGPTSSYRMDPYLEFSLKLGIAATLGKGERTSLQAKLIKKYKAPYLITIGGAGAYLAGCIKTSKAILFEDLGAEAVMELTVENLPVIVCMDIYGNDLFA